MAAAALWLAFVGLIARQGLLRAPGGGDLLHQEMDPATTGKIVQPTPPTDTTGTLRSSGPVAPVPLPPPPDMSAERPAPVRPTVAIAPDPDMDRRLNDLRVCRFDIASERHVAAARVRVGEVELRWTVVPDGSVEQAEVVAVRATDPDVMSCMKRKMDGWRFAPRLPTTPAPRSVERLSFR
jgi:hypothetical protein